MKIHDLNLILSTSQMLTLFAYQKRPWQFQFAMVYILTYAEIRLRYALLSDSLGWWYTQCMFGLGLIGFLKYKRNNSYSWPASRSLVARKGPPMHFSFPRNVYGETSFSPLRYERRMVEHRRLELLTFTLPV